MNLTYTSTELMYLMILDPRLPSPMLLILFWFWQDCWATLAIFGRKSISHLGQTSARKTNMQIICHCEDREFWKLNKYRIKWESLISCPNARWGCSPSSSRMERLGAILPCLPHLPSLLAWGTLRPVVEESGVDAELAEEIVADYFYGAPSLHIWWIWFDQCFFNSAFQGLIDIPPG